ncbi:MAG: T9SS type A sorting domain-containing protein, partial [Cyclobacteriaceae bacterium]|nr:T9SS type A sorting domain-containing protein [Cyclobacteriaceae bacterium]
SIRINQDKYYHDDFQFRFRSSGRKSGRYDTWHIDYIYMNRGRTDTDLSLGFPDRAPYLYLTSLFGEYFSIPHNHFITDTNGNTGFPTFGISNLSSIPQPMNYTVNGDLKVFTNGVSTDQSLNVASAVPILPTMQGFEKREITFSSKPNLASIATADSVFLTLQTTLVTGDSVNTGFEPINFYLNDTIRQTYTLKDFYAYDDGSAEYAVGLTQTGNMAAYRFVLKTNAQDTINGVYIHYPYTSGTSASNTKFMVWDNDNGKPGQLLMEELVPVQRKSNNEFILRAFVQSVIVQDTFFIGWRQPLSGRVQIGLDAQNNSGDQLFVNVTGNWVENYAISGSVMIRPRFGTGDVVTSIEERYSEIEVFPNPNTGEFIIKGELNHIEIISSTGQPVQFQKEEFEQEKRIRITNPTQGLFILRYQSGNNFFAKKIVIKIH